MPSQFSRLVCVAPEHWPLLANVQLSTTTLAEEDEGKVLVDAEGEELGVVTEVEGDVGYVDPDPGLSESALAAFGQADHNEDDIVIEDDIVAVITDEEVRLRGDDQVNSLTNQCPVNRPPPLIM